jgi:chorismate dehydratase
MLLIGDAALRSSISASALHVYDLGSLWFEWTGLPFVFALWLCTRKAASERHGEMRRLAEQLVRAKEYAVRERERIADVTPEASWMGRDALVAYWRDNISYELEAPQVEGVRRFFTLAAELGLIPQAPELNFFELTA